MNKIGSFLPKVLDSMIFIPSFQSYVSKVVLMDFPSVFWKLPRTPRFLLMQRFPRFPQDTALDLHNELLLWYVCEDAEALP